MKGDFIMEKKFDIAELILVVAMTLLIAGTFIGWLVDIESGVILYEIGFGVGFLGMLISDFVQDWIDSRKERANK